jgi:excisionase family DNA binding protein
LKPITRETGQQRSGLYLKRIEHYQELMCHSLALSTAFWYCSLDRFASNRWGRYFMQSDIESALIGISHLAERLGLSRRTIHRILARGELPSLQIGQRRLIRLSDVRTWLSGCGTTTPDANLTNLSRQFR